MTTDGGAGGRGDPGPGAVALIGDPVAQSPSPAMHRAAFRELGLPLDYVAVRVPREDLAVRFPDLRRRFIGLNVTRPLKEAVLALLDRVDPAAARAGSVNTVVFGPDGSAGHSTDGAGFLAALARAGAPPPARALVLGTGGAARAVAAALLDAGSSVLVWGRRTEASARLAADLGDGAAPLPPDPALLADALPGCGLLVNATPVGAWPDPAASPLPDGVPLQPGLVVFDLVYRPRRTALLSRAVAAGCLAVEGVAMLVEQGAASLRIWTGREPPTEVMRSAALQALDSPPEAATERGVGEALRSRGGDR